MKAAEGTFRRLETWIAVLAILAIVTHLVLRFALKLPANLPLYVALALGGGPLVWELLVKLLRREFGSDLLAGISIVTSVILGEYLAGVLVVLMLSGGEALEGYAVRSASSVLRALAKRMPAVAHRRRDSVTEDVPLSAIAVGDTVVVYPHEICPVDGVVVEGHGVMDESYLTGEPYMMSKTTGAPVFSGAINGESVLTIRAEKLPVDSRYAKIMQVMQSAEQHRPRIRRLADQLGAWYTPVAVGLAVAAWAWSGEAVRFLAVLVVATPCPLLIAIPVAIIGSISLAAKRGIIIKDPVALETVGQCRTLIFDKTGTLTYGEPELVEQVVAPGLKRTEVLAVAAGLERYSKHPLAEPILKAARAESVVLHEASEISERPGAGLRGTVAGKSAQITSRQHAGNCELPAATGGMECVVLIEGKFAALYRFRDTPRREGSAFVGHLSPKHSYDRVMLVSGDRASEVNYLAEQVGIREVHAQQSPEQKLAIVRAETARTATVFVEIGRAHV